MFNIFIQFVCVTHSHSVAFSPSSHMHFCMCESERERRLKICFWCSLFPSHTWRLRFDIDDDDYTMKKTQWVNRISLALCVVFFFFVYDVCVLVFYGNEYYVSSDEMDSTTNKQKYTFSTDENWQRTPIIICCLNANYMKAELTEQSRKRTNNTTERIHAYYTQTSACTHSTSYLISFGLWMHGPFIWFFRYQPNKKMYTKRMNRVIFIIWTKVFFSRIFFYISWLSQWFPLNAIYPMPILFDSSKFICVRVYWHRFVCHVQKLLLIGHQNYFTIYMNIGNSSNSTKNTRTQIFML